MATDCRNSPGCHFPERSRRITRFRYFSGAGGVLMRCLVMLQVRHAATILSEVSFPPSWRAIRSAGFLFPSPPSGHCATVGILFEGRCALESLPHPDHAAASDATPSTNPMENNRNEDIHAYFRSGEARQSRPRLACRARHYMYYIHWFTNQVCD
jgi:hypothetical protein